jgi:hypothetical protein
MLPYRTRLRPHILRSVEKSWWPFSTLLRSLSYVEMFKSSFYCRQWHRAAWWLTISSQLSKFLSYYYFTRLWHFPAFCWRRWVHLRHTVHILKMWLLSANYFCQVNWAFTLKSYENKTRRCWIKITCKWR